ncbi:MAG: gliding motility-associated C-terminal domain-containing protein [Flavobacteriales bacterium]|nr:gliding motility-associated C-terminal domain-containing protein [Flavobacteriales bacterium]
MKKLVLLLMIPLLSGCFKDEPKLPQYYAKQEIDVAVDSVICYSAQEDFDYFILTCSTPFDSIHWYNGYQNQVFLGSGQPFEIPNNPHEWEVIKCIGFNSSDTTEILLNLNYCARNLYIPTSFTPDDNGINDKWYPIFYQTDWDTKPYSIHWEIRTTDGLKVFEADDLNGSAWDGEYNGYGMPRGIYFYQIELTISGEEPIVYTGWLDMIG